MGRFDKLQKLADFPQILSTGGDQEMPDCGSANGDKDYFLKPDPKAIVRSSCSVSVPTQSGYDLAKLIYDKMKSGETNVDECMEMTREELKKFYDLPEGTGIFFAPSNNSAQLIPILIAKALNSEKEKFVSILTYESDVGKKFLAAGGLPWSDIKPIEEHHFIPLYKFSDNVEVKTMKARDSNGNIIDNDWNIK